MVSNLLRRAKLFLPFIGLIILFLIVYSLNINLIIDAFLSINLWYVIAALSLSLPMLLARNAAWQLIMRDQKVHVGFFYSAKLFLIGLFYGIITPGYVGELARVAYLKERTEEPYGKLFVNTVVETFVHTLSLYGMMVIGAVLVVGTLPNLLPLTVLWVIAVCLIALYFSRKGPGEKVFHILIRYAIPKKMKEQLSAFVDTFYLDFPHFKAMILPFLLGIITWVIVFTQEYIIALSLGLTIPFLMFLLLYPIANTAGFIPITFAGLGTREFTAILIFSTLYAIPQEKILVLSLVGFMVTDVFVGLLGFVLSLTETRSENHGSEINGD
jgi:uncharacterized protein (TIRG00374 family)